MDPRAWDNRRVVQGARHVGGALCVLLAFWAAPLRAQDRVFLGVAEHLTAPGPYRGPTRALEVGGPRPAGGGLRACSVRLPLCVHAARAQDAPQVARALAALERAYDWLAGHGLALPYPDGGAGGTLGFDLYLVHGLPREQDAAAMDAEPEQLATHSPLDAATAFAQLDASLPPDALDRCALAALCEAGLLARDPAEQAALRRASAMAVSWLASADGELGCVPAGDAAQAHANLGLLGDAPAQEAALGALLLFLDRRHGGGNGSFIAELWELAAQHSDAPNALHARPSVWQALARVLERAGESLDADAEELALLRFTDPSALGFPAAVRPPPLATLEAERLPAAVSSQAPLGSYGSAYVLVNVPDPRPGAQLRVWLRADAGERWSLLAARLDAHGRVLSKLSAPPRTLPESYLPVELEPGTAQVLVAVTALPLEDAAQRAEGERAAEGALDEHHFRVTLALSGGQAAAAR